jgi:hypothetical protein
LIGKIAIMTDKVEITEKGLKILKIEAALMGLPQKAALEQLLINGAREDTFKLVEREEINFCVSGSDAPVPPGNTFKFSLNERQRLALSYILNEFNAGNEPTVVEVAEKLGITPKKLGTSLTKIGIRSKPIRKENSVIRAYGFELKPLAEIFLRW